MKKLLTGNEAVARGAFESGVSFVTGYPGTPSTEILECLSKYPDVYAAWSANEKTALEMASGASLGGKRALVAMKHVGLNVASDPLMTLSLTGIRAGLVIVVSDDPGMHSSQNDQDSRFYARFAKIPMLEPSDSNEALLFIKEAFTISETFDTPVLLRLTASISHSASLVEIGERTDIIDLLPEKRPEKYVMLPPYCNQRRVVLEERLKSLGKFSDTFHLNKIEYLFPEKGVITAGISYQYVKEAVHNASVLKIAMTNPLPLKLIKKFSEKVKKLFVIEELDPFMEDAIRAEGIEVIEKSEDISSYGEHSISIIRNFIEGNGGEGQTAEEDGGRFCAGCPYLGVFYCLQQSGCFVFGDIGCYTLGAKLFPGSIDTTLCMGAGISQAAGFLKARPDAHAVSIIGDSTFFHSGIPGIINALYHRTPITLIILDNGVTAMTGGQSHAGRDINIRDLLRAIGLRDVKEIDPYDINLIENTIKDSLNTKEISVIIVKGRCVVRERPKNFRIEASICDNCFLCLELKCPALTRQNGIVAIGNQCIGCGLCVSRCPKGAIVG